MAVLVAALVFFEDIVVDAVVAAHVEVYVDCVGNDEKNGGDPRNPKDVARQIGCVDVRFAGE